MVTRYQNLHLANKSLFTQYRTLFATSITNAQALLSNSALTNKTFRATNYNSMTSNLLTIENYYYTNVPTRLATLLANVATYHANIVDKGTYSATTAYSVGNMVDYNNLIYFCIQASTGNLPTDTTYWLALGLRGVAGADSMGVTLVGVWSALTTYAQKDAVTYDNYIWIALQGSTGQTPSDGSAYWQKLINLNYRKINFSSTGLTAGDILWQEIS